MTNHLDHLAARTFRPTTRRVLITVVIVALTVLLLPFGAVSGTSLA